MPLKTAFSPPICAHILLLWDRFRPRDVWLTVGVQERTLGQMGIVLQSTVRPSALAVERETLASQLADKLRLAIVENELLPGARLTETSIAVQAGVSRSTVREALRILARDGLVSLVPMSGARVALLSQGDIEEITEARLAVEVLAARKLTVSNDEPKMAATQARLRDLIRAAKSSAWVNIVDADVGFHRSIVEAAANGRLFRFWEQLEGQLLLFLSLHADEAYPIDEFAREHEILVDAIRSGDPDVTAEAFERHIRSRMDVRERLWSSEAAGGAASGEVRKAIGRKRMRPRPES